MGMCVSKDPKAGWCTGMDVGTLPAMSHHVQQRSWEAVAAIERTWSNAHRLHRASVRVLA